MRTDLTVVVCGAHSAPYDLGRRLILGLALSNCSIGKNFGLAGKMLLTANRGALNMRPVLEMGL